MAMLPCGDFVSDNKTMSIVETTHVEDHHDHDHGNETDACSPFCICACCGLSFNAEKPKIKIPTPIKYTNKEFPLYDVKINSNEFLFIWKPPQIS